MRHLAGGRRELKARHPGEIAGQRQRQDVHLLLGVGGEVGAGADRRRAACTSPTPSPPPAAARRGCSSRPAAPAAACGPGCRAWASELLSSLLSWPGWVPLPNSCCRMKAVLSGPVLVDDMAGKQVDAALVGSRWIDVDAGRVVDHARLHLAIGEVGRVADHELDRRERRAGLEHGADLLIDADARWPDSPSRSAGPERGHPGLVRSLGRLVVEAVEDQHLALEVGRPGGAADRARPWRRAPACCGT